MPILPMKTNYVQNSFFGIGVLWNVYKFYGIDFCFTGTEKRKLRQFLMKFIPFVLHLTLAYDLCASFTMVHHNPRKLLHALPLSLSSLISILLWHTLYKKRINKERLLKKFCKIKMLLEDHVTAEKNHHSLYVNLSIVVGIIVPITSSLYVTLAFADPESPKNLFHGFFIRFPNNTATGPLIRTATSQSINALQYTFPALTSTLCSAIYYKYSNLVRDYSLLLKNIGFSDSSDKVPYIVKVHKMIYDVGHDTDGFLSSVVFLLLCHQVVLMYVTLSMFVASASGAVPSSVWESLPSMTVVPLCVVIQVVCAGRVPKKFSEINLLLKAAQDKFVAEGNFHSDVLKLIRLLIDEPFPKMTAWGMVELNHSFIFTIFGTLLTYGLLVVNIYTEVSIFRKTDLWEGV